MGHPLGFVLFGAKSLSYLSMLLVFTAPSKVRMIICGVFWGSMRPGMMVPSLEQKQCGNSQLAVSHFTAKSTGGSVTGAGAAIIHDFYMNALLFSVSYRHFDMMVRGRLEIFNFRE